MKMISLYSGVCAETDIVSCNAQIVIATAMDFEKNLFTSVLCFLFVLMLFQFVKHVHDVLQLLLVGKGNADFPLSACRE